MPEADNNDTVVFRVTDLPDDKFFLCSMQGREAISQLYEFHVMLQSEAALAAGDLKTVLQKPCAIGFSPGGADGPTSEIHGVVRAIETIPQFESNVMRYLVTVVPRLWYLTQTVRARVYLELSVPDIVKAVLTEAGLEAGTDFDIKTSASHPVRDFCVQYQESDFAFVSRLLEYEGMFYFFDHTGSIEKLVIGDANTATAAADPAELPFHPLGGVVDTHQSIVAIRQVHQTVPFKAFVRDYNNQLPASIVECTTAGTIDETWPSDRVGHGLQVYLHEGVLNPAAANRIAKLRAEEHFARQTVFPARSTLFGLHPGQAFTLIEHGTFDDTKLLVTEMSHGVDQEGLLEMNGPAEGNTASVSYFNEFDAIPHAVPFRPQRLTPRPRIDGVIHGVVDATDANQEAFIDDQGRYHVVMPYDTVGAVGGKATIPISLAQSYSGPGYGMHFPLHSGVEVLVAHVDGDPDRPVIVGTVSNPRMVSPVIAPDKTVNRIITRSKITIRFDDDA